MTPNSTDPRVRYSTQFPEMPGERRARFFWGLGIGLIVGLVSAIIRWDTRTWTDVLLRMAVCGIVFGLFGWRLGDRFWRNPLWWLVAMALVGVVLAFF
jgi:RsiW-degrading membrane proteinase PrsW (M82 family)